MVSPVPPTAVKTFKVEVAAPEATQAKDVHAPHEPESNCNSEVAPRRFAPILLKLMIGYEVVAVNWYQTSPEVAEPQPPGTPAVAAAHNNEPAVLEQVCDSTSVEAARQSSFNSFHDIIFFRTVIPPTD
jgi:hypothetical protein